MLSLSIVQYTKSSTRLSRVRFVGMAGYFANISLRGKRANFYNYFARIDNLHMNEKIKLCCKPNIPAAE